jgi:hypothetical protein
MVAVKTTFRCSGVLLFHPLVPHSFFPGPFYDMRREWTVFASHGKYYRPVLNQENFYGFRRLLRSMPLMHGTEPGG